MKATWVIAKREIFSYFSTPMAYVVLTVWTLSCGLQYYLMAEWFSSQPSTGGSDTPLSAFFGQTTLLYILLLVFAGVLTMKLIAEETRTGTLEALLTAPVSSTSVVLGKYLAAMVFWTTLWLPTLLYVWITSRYGDVDLGAVAASYLGVFGIGLYYMAVGLLMSAIAPNQVIASVLTFMVLGLLFMLGIGQFVFHEARAIFEYLSVWQHMEDFSRGIVDTRYLTYDVSLAGLALFLAQRRLEARRA